MSGINFRRLDATERGFTIIELMVAMVIFSVVLLMVSFSIIEIQRIYYKGLTNSKTQEAARSIIQDVSQAIQFNGGQITGNGTDVYCVGNRRYSYAIGQKVTDIPTEVHGLVADKPGTCGSAPQDLTPPPALSSGSIELLGVNMRLSKFTISGTIPSSNNLYNVTIRVVYGDDDLLCSPAINNCTASATMTAGQISAATDLTCKHIRAGTQFCAVSELSTTVQQRVK